MLVVEIEMYIKALVCKWGYKYCYVPRKTYWCNDTGKCKIWEQNFYKCSLIPFHELTALDKVHHHFISFVQSCRVHLFHSDVVWFCFLLCMSSFHDKVHQYQKQFYDDKYQIKNKRLYIIYSLRELRDKFECTIDFLF